MGLGRILDTLEVTSATEAAGALRDLGNLAGRLDDTTYDLVCEGYLEPDSWSCGGTLLVSLFGYLMVTGSQAAYKIECLEVTSRRIDWFERRPRVRVRITFASEGEVVGGITGGWLY